VPHALLERPTEPARQRYREPHFRTVQNILRQAQLECDLLESGYEPYAGENVADSDVWADEESCFVPDISVAEALALGEKYGQNAIVCGSDDGVPELVWICGEATS